MNYRNRWGRPKPINKNMNNILRELKPNDEFRLYYGDLNPKFRREEESYPGEFGDVFIVVTDLRSGKKKVIPDTHYVYKV
jgi:hypothetical protein